jgi:hypothetical protein
MMRLFGWVTAVISPDVKRGTEQRILPFYIDLNFTWISGSGEPHKWLRSPNILSYHRFTRTCFNPCLRFLLTFAKNTHRIRVFRLVQRVSCAGLDAIC